MRKDSMIVIGDPHGNFKTLEALIAQFPKDVPFCIAGDLIDRGPRSKEVVQFCIDNNIPVVTGNHEMMATDWFDNGKSYNDMLWLGNGGDRALNSYRESEEGNPLKGEVDWELFEKHIEYFRTLPLTLHFPDVKNEEGRELVVSHSSVHNVWGWSEERKQQNKVGYENSIVWGRPATIKDVPEIYNIFGHTPHDDNPRIRVSHANVDTGCFYEGPDHYKLTGLQYPEMIVYQQENIDWKKPEKKEETDGEQDS